MGRGKGSPGPIYIWASSTSKGLIPRTTTREGLASRAYAERIPRSSLTHRAKQGTLAMFDDMFGSPRRGAVEEEFGKDRWELMVKKNDAQRAVWRKQDAERARQGPVAIRSGVQGRSSAPGNFAPDLREAVRGLRGAVGHFPSPEAFKYMATLPAGSRGPCATPPLGGKRPTGKGATQFREPRVIVQPTDSPGRPAALSLLSPEREIPKRPRQLQSPAKHRRTVPRYQEALTLSPKP